MIRTTTAFLLLLTLSTIAQAEPSKAEAEKWLNDFTVAREKTYDSKLMGNDEQRIAYTQVLNKLRDRAEKLFGDTPHHCTSAIYSVSNYWIDVNYLMSNPTDKPQDNLSQIVSLSFDSGHQYLNCLKLIDNLNPN